MRARIEVDKVTAALFSVKIDVFAENDIDALKEAVRELGLAILYYETHNQHNINWRSSSD